MRRRRHPRPPVTVFLRLLLAALGLVALPFVGGGCADASGGAPSGIQAARVSALRARIAAEEPGDYFVGRRYYNQNYKFWGYVRRPGQPWKTSQLVMLNEKLKLAPDREINQLGVDDNCEYRLSGRFTGDKVYEPASNSFYPEFELNGFQLTDRNPPSIFPSGGTPPPTGILRPD